MLKVETMLLFQLNPDDDVVVLVVVVGIAAWPYCLGQLESSQKGKVVAGGWGWHQKSNDSLILFKLRAHKSKDDGRHGRHTEGTQQETAKRKKCWRGRRRRENKKAKNEIVDGDDGCGRAGDGDRGEGGGRAGERSHSENNKVL